MDIRFSSDYMMGSRPYIGSMACGFTTNIGDSSRDGSINWEVGGEHQADCRM